MTVCAHHDRIGVDVDGPREEYLGRMAFPRGADLRDGMHRMPS